MLFRVYMFCCGMFACNSLYCVLCRCVFYVVAQCAYFALLRFNSLCASFILLYCLSSRYFDVVCVFRCVLFYFVSLRYMSVHFDLPCLIYQVLCVILVCV